MAKSKHLGTAVQLLGKAKCAPACVQLMGLKAELLETVVRLLCAEAECAGAHLKLMRMIEQTSGDTSPTPLGSGQTCRGIRETHWGETHAAEHISQTREANNKHTGAACPCAGA